MISYLYCRGDVAESAEGGTLLRCYMGQPVSWVRIPPSPNLNPPQGGFLLGILINRWVKAQPTCYKLFS